MRHALTSAFGCIIVAESGLIKKKVKPSLGRNPSFIRFLKLILFEVTLKMARPISPGREITSAQFLTDSPDPLPVSIQNRNSIMTVVIN